MKNTILEIFGKNTLQNLVSFPLGFLGNTSLNRSNKDGIFIFINNRPVKSKIIEEALIDGYYTKLMKGKYPFAILFLNVDPKEVDVNVHPSKKIVKFSDEEEIYNFVLKKIESTFERDDNFVSPTLTEKIEKDEKRFLDFSDFENFTPIKGENQRFENMNTPIEDKIEDEKEEIIEKKMSIESEELSYEIDENYDQEEEKIEENSINIVKNKKEIKKDIVLQKSSDIIDTKFRIIGQVFDTFILVEREGIFEIYDQHIVHERILYEKLKKMYYSDKTSMQQLLVPIRVSIDPRELEIISENIEEFKKSGFEIDRFSDNEILIRSVPILDFNDSTENIFRNVLNNIKEKRYTDIRENILISMSCKGAIKANQKLSFEEMETMVRKLHEIGEYTCPHGRPIIVKITLDDLEKLFKRK